MTQIKNYICLASVSVLPLFVTQCGNVFSSALQITGPLNTSGQNAVAVTSQPSLVSFKLTNIGNATISLLPNSVIWSALSPATGLAFDHTDAAGGCSLTTGATSSLAAGASCVLNTYFTSTQSTGMPIGTASFSLMFSMNSQNKVAIPQIWGWLPSN
jgi:hypothetical protein